MGMSILSIVGLLIIGLALAHSKWERMALKNGYGTTGKVMDFQPDIKFFNGGTQHSMEFPIVEYLDTDGGLRSDQMNTSSRVGKFQLGDEFEIVKFENKLHHRKSNYLRSIVIGAAGILVFILGNL